MIKEEELRDILADILILLSSAIDLDTMCSCSNCERYRKVRDKVLALEVKDGTD